MPWKEYSKVSLRREFVILATAEDANVAELCRRFRISRKSGYKWIRRLGEEGVWGLCDRSRRPHSSPYRTAAHLEQAVVELRRKHPPWGGRKLRKRLQGLGHNNVPAASTITDICRRHGLIDPGESLKHKPCIRFEHEAPNDLWQMDFKGHFPMKDGRRCHPLSVLDDHSRFSLGLRACRNEDGKTVGEELTAIFRRYGLPGRILVDNGPPWGNSLAEHGYTPLTVWLLRLDIGMSHGRAGHPQTQGKNERFHRTLKAEVLFGNEFCNLKDCQRRFDPWREVYNHQRPHEALGMATPASRYRVSDRPFPERLRPLEYGGSEIVRLVRGRGKITLEGREYHVCKAFVGHAVGLRPRGTDGCFDVYFGHHLVGELDLRRARAGGPAFTLPDSVRYAHCVRQSESPTE